MDYTEGMSGLVCSSIDVFKCLEGLENLKTLYVSQWNSKIGDVNAFVDFRNTGLTYVFMRGVMADIYFPNTVTYIYSGNRWSSNIRRGLKCIIIINALLA